MSKLVKKNELTFSTDQKALIKKTVAQGCTDDELKLFFYQCERTKLDPFSKQIYMIKRGGKSSKATIQTGIDGFRAIAERTGKYAGNDEYLFDGGKTEYECISSELKQPNIATACIKKVVDGVICEFKASASWKSYCPQGSDFMWKKMPFLMLGKCAEALALRKAFPNDLSGIYTKDEMDQDEGNDINAIQNKTESKTEDLANSVSEVKEVEEIEEVVAEVVEDPNVMSLDLEASIRTALESKYVDDDTRKKVANWLKNEGLPKASAEECLGKLEKRIEEGKINEEKNKDEVEYNVDDIPG